MESITVIIPSRCQSLQAMFIERAVQSIQRQTVLSNFNMDIVVGLDQGDILPRDLCDRLGIRFVQSDGRSQAAALNTAASELKGTYLAFLEDDDQWHPKYLECALDALRLGDFVSSTQLEIDETGEVIRINDFPTPSGWLMRSETWMKVGEFNAEYRVHLDNEWLGRLTESRTGRVHMVESTAPVNIQMMRKDRPRLANVALSGGTPDCNRFMRHKLPFPLVLRLVHKNSGMAQIATNTEWGQRSQEELGLLKQRFQRIPW